ncbi:MAG: DUF6152 family protein [Bryobacteraceae bacterium]|jgi:hypothetical protein
MKAKLAALLVVAIAPVMAHHSFAAEFDGAKEVTISGKVLRVDWVNPHAALHIAVTNSDGKVEEWNCEMPPPGRLAHAGWRADMVKAGDQISVSGFLARNGAHIMWTQSVVFPDGSRISVRPAR